MNDIIGKKYIFLGISVLLMSVAFFSILRFGFREGIDFTGGTLWQVQFERQEVKEGELREFFASTLSIEDVIITREARGGSYLMRTRAISEDDHQKALLAMKEMFGALEEQSFQSIGPAVGSELQRNAYIAVVLVLLGISLFIAIAFRKVSFPVMSWKYGVATLISLFHDVLIPAGLFAYLGHIKGVEVDTNFIVALLVVMGFSVHDTIVVFDRIRENLILERGKLDFSKVVNKSINETMARSINTSCTLVLVLLALLATGPTTLFYFVLTILVGVVLGTYSSIFVASPILVVWQEFTSGARKK